MSTTGDERTHNCDHDVVIVGGGPAGCAAAIFIARYGLDTVIFDRGRSSIQRCAHLENYLGFPAGVDIETLYELMHDHAEEAGCVIVSDLVESVELTTELAGFIVHRQDGNPVTANRVVAATRYDGEYMRGLDDDAAMFEEYEFDGETHETFDSEYSDQDGSTSVDRLYVASPSPEDRQALIAAGRGARVGLQVVEDIRDDRGYLEGVVDHYDWVRQEAELDVEWSDRDRWREWFDNRLPEDHTLNEDRQVALRERDIDRTLKTYLEPDEIARRAERGQKRLLDHIDDELILEVASDITAERDLSGVNH